MLFGLSACAILALGAIGELWIVVEFIFRLNSLIVYVQKVLHLMMFLVLVYASAWLSGGRLSD